jgi:hypothetical protein
MAEPATLAGAFLRIAGGPLLKALLPYGKKLAHQDPVSRMIRATCKSEDDPRLATALRVWIEGTDFQDFVQMEASRLTDEAIVASFVNILRHTSHPAADEGMARRILATFFDRWRYEELHGDHAIATADSLSAMRDAATDERLRKIEQLVANLPERLLASSDVQFTGADEPAFIEQVPPAPARVAPRSETLTTLRRNVAARTWTSLIGEPESGKTQIAVLLSRQWENVQWFSGYNLSSADAIIRRLGAISGSSRSGAPVAAAVRVLGAGTLVVLDDLPQLDNRDPRASLLRDFAAAGTGRLHILSLGSTNAPRLVRDVLGDAFVSCAMPPFTTEEARELFGLYGAPVTLDESTVAFLNAVAAGNPTLLNALAKYLQAHGWAIDGEIQRLLSGVHLQEIGGELLTRLRNDVQDPETRELFARTRLARRGLTAADIRALAAVDPVVDHVSERLLDLDGLWLRRQSRDRYEPAPLAKALPGSDLQLATERECHTTLAMRIIASRRIDRHDLMDAMFHFVEAKEFDRAGTLFVGALVSIAHEDVPEETIVPAMYTATPLPEEMALSLRLVIRTQQLKIARKQQKAYPRHLLADASRLVSQATPEEAAVVANFVTEIAFFDRGDREAWSAAMDAVAKLTDLQPAGSALSFMGQSLPNETWGMLFYMVGRAVRTVDDVDRWTDAADRLSVQQRQQVLATAFDRQSLVNAAWLRVAKSEAPAWTDVLAVHRRWREWADRTEDRLLRAYAARAEIIVRCEYLDDCDAALAFAREMLHEASDTHERFILAEAIATQYRRLRRYEEAERSYEQAFFDLDAATTTERVFALHNAASVVARRDVVAAAAYLEQAREIVRESPEQFDALRPAMIAADLGLAYWYAARQMEAFHEWESAAATLIDDAAIEDDARRGMIALFMTVLLQVADAGRLEAPEGDERAVVGIFDRDMAALATHSKPPQIALLATELASIAAMIGNDRRASEWSERAVAAARAAGTPAATAYVAMQALPWALLRNDYEEAGRLLHEIHAVPEKLRSPGNSEIAQYALLAAFQLCALMLTDSAAAQHGLAVVRNSLDQHRDGGDINVLGDLLEATRSGSYEDLHRLSQPADVVTAAGTMARLFRVAVLPATSEQRAVDHLHIAHASTLRASLWSAGYSRIVVPYFEAFWERELKRNAFRFNSPEETRRRFEAARALPVEKRVRRILEIVTDSLAINLSVEFRAWLRAP